MVGTKKFSQARKRLCYMLTGQILFSSSATKKAAVLRHSLLPCQCQLQQPWLQRMC